MSNISDESALPPEEVEVAQEQPKTQEEKKDVFVKTDNAPDPTLGVKDSVFVINNIDQGLRAANILSTSSLVPDIFNAKKTNSKEALANCLLALNMSRKMDADVLMVMQNMYIVHNKPSWSSQFLISCFNTCGKFSSIKYEEKDASTPNWSVRAYTTEFSSGDRVNGPWVSIKMAADEGWSKKNGSKWNTMPELMLRYRAAAFLIRTTAPEIAMGLQTQEELRDITQSVTEDGEVIFNSTKSKLDHHKATINNQGENK